LLGARTKSQRPKSTTSRQEALKKIRHFKLLPGQGQVGTGIQANIATSMCPRLTEAE